MNAASTPGTATDDKRTGLLETPEWTDWKEDTIEGERGTEEEARQHTLRVGNATSIGIGDSAWSAASSWGDRRRYERLDSINRDAAIGHLHGVDDTEMWRSFDAQFKIGVVNSLGQDLCLSQLQQQRVIDRLFRLDLPRIGRRLELVAFCLCALVVREEAEARYNTPERLEGSVLYHPQRPPEANPEAFDRVEAALIDQFGTIDRRSIQSVYAKLSQGNPPKRESDAWKPIVADAAKVPLAPPPVQEFDERGRRIVQPQPDPTPRI